MLQFHDFGALTSKLTDMACQFNSWKVPNFQNSTYQTFKAEDLGQQMFKIQDLLAKCGEFKILPVKH